MTTAIETKGKSKVTVDDVLAIRRLKVKNPDMSSQKIKDTLKLELSAIMVGRAIRGISHSHIDMCGLPVRPFNTEAAPKVAAPKKVAKATKPAPKPSVKKAAKPAAKVAKTAKPTAKKKK